MGSLPPLILDLAIMLGIASIVTLFFQRIGQPVVLGYLVAGIIIGPYTPPHVLVNDISNIKILSELGVIFLIFSLGLEFSFHKLVRVGFPATLTGFIEVILMTVLGFILGKMLGWSFNNALFLGAAISISSTTIIIKAIEELDLSKEHFAELIFGVLIVEDLFAILLLVMLSTAVITEHFFSINIIWVTGKLILVIGGWFIVGYFLIPSFHRLIRPYASEESITIVSVSLCLLLVSLASYLNYSIALGAFIMGSILAETNSIYRIRILIKPIRDIFGAVFFIATGMLMNPHIVIEQWPTILIVTLVTVVGKIICSGLAIFSTGRNIKTSLRVGFGMAQIGEFSFIIIGLGVVLDVVHDDLYPIIVAVSIITTFSTPYLIRFSGYIIEVLDRKLSEPKKLFIENYSSSVFGHLSILPQDGFYKFFMARLIINGIIIAILFILSYEIFFPTLYNLINDMQPTKTMCWIAACLLSSPFICGMFFSKKYSKGAGNLYFYIACFLVTLEIALLSLIYFRNNWIIIAVLLFLMMVFITISYKRLEKIYLWFENHLTRNVHSRSESKKYEDLAPWETYLVEVSLGEEGEFIKTSLKDSKIRQQFGINIIAIQRDLKIIFSPSGNEVFLPYDKLIILGEEEQISEFRKKVEKQEINEETKELLDNVVLKAVQLNKKSNLIGKTIRTSKIREKMHGIVVGLERAGKRILNPDPNTRLLENDIVFIAGETKYLE